MQGGIMKLTSRYRVAFVFIRKNKMVVSAVIHIPSTPSFAETLWSMMPMPDYI